MKLVDLTCQRCGALLKVDVDKKQATCQHCGATILIDDEVQYIRLDNAEEIGYSFEKGRQRAQAEARQGQSSSIRMQSQQGQSNSIRMQSQQGYASNHPSKKKKGTCWKALLWMYFFPIMLTIFLIKTDKIKIPIKIVLIALLWISFIIFGATNNTGSKTNIDVISTNTEIDVEKTNDVTGTEKSEESKTNKEEGEGIQNENLKGRGMSDSGRSEPQYVNVIGYVVVGHDQNYKLEHTENFENTDLWVISTYEQDKQFWNDTGVIIPHKTEVIVREQILNYEGYEAYSGYLLVESIEDGKQYYINVSNFVTKPYWTYSDDLRSAALTGYFIAVYHQVSDYYPITNGGDKAEIEDGKVVLVNGVAGLSRNVDPNETGIDAVVWQEWRWGYGDVTIHFNAEDLTIIY